MPEIIEKAFQLAESGQPGPVLVNVPMDIFSKEIDSNLFQKNSLNTDTLIKPSLDDETAKKIVSSIANSNDPVLYVGGGILLARASSELEEFVNHLQIPVAHSLMGKGALSDSNPFVLGMTGFWGTELVNQSCLNADTILAIGTRFKEADSSSWYPGYTFNIPETKLIHIDEVGVIADARSALTVLTRVAKELYPNGIDRPEVRNRIKSFRENFKKSNEEMASSDAFPMMPERILADTRLALPNDAIITTDVGWNKNGVGQQFDILTPGSILTPGGFATMGFGPPAAIGAKIANPDRVVISLVGDGGFGQNPAMLATAVERDLSIIWIVMNNNAFGTIAGLQKAHYGVTYGTVFPGEVGNSEMSPNYSDIAKAYGAKGIRISSADELLPALKASIQEGKPTVIDVAMINNPTPTTGHWNILDIYSPNDDVSHVST
jgi:acetolactate synthase-1/2/3 large subunit